MSSSGDDESVQGQQQQQQSVLEGADDNTLRIMLSTDNHLGYAERDPVRGLDSFAAFEEVLYLAKRFHCDMVLIAGDLFHENRPSRRTLHKTMEIIRRYCMGPDPVRIQILSDQAKNFRNTVSGTVNYQDEYYSVDLPIFSIHGNHDDPSRDAGGDLLAALDLLAVSNLVNYFGRHEQVDKIEVSPVLIQKGTTKVALYGMGSMRDERLNRMWQGKKVRFLRPEEDEDEDDDDEDDDEGFFNLFTLHQNRDLGRGAKNCVQESMIPEWMDLVVWGHEHECLIEFFESVVGTFRITQPGSSVATSLVAGEAVRKKVGILDINGKNFRLHPVPLTQVRGFVTTEVSLKEHKANLDPEDNDIDKKVEEILDEEVRLMVLNARDKRKEVLDDAKAAGNNAGDKECPIKYKLFKPNEVLVRIRVEHSGFTTLSGQRFGARYVGDVANPTDILLFHRRKEAKPSGSKSSKQRDAMKNPIIPEELERTNMEDLVMEHLDRLTLLDKKKLNEALEEYVDKNQISTISESTQNMLKEQQKKMFRNIDKGADKLSQVREIIDVEMESKAAAEEEEEERAKAKASSKKRRSRSNQDDDGDEELEEAGDMGKENSLDDDEPPPVRPNKRSSGGSKPKAARTAAPKDDAKRKAARRKHLLDDDDDEDDEMIEVVSKPKAKTTARPQRSSSKRPKSYAIDDGDDDDEDSNAVIAIDDDDDEDLLDLEEEPPAKKKRAKKTSSTTTTTLSRSRTTHGTTRKTKSSRKKKSSRIDDSDDDDDYADNNSAELEDDWGSAITRSQI